MEQWLVVASLEFLGHNQVAIRVFLDLLCDLATWEAVQLCLRLLLPTVFRFPRESDYRFVGTLSFQEVRVKCLEVFNRLAYPSGDHNCPRLTADLALPNHTLLKMVDHYPGFLMNSVVMSLNIPP